MGTARFSRTTSQCRGRSIRSLPGCCRSTVFKQLAISYRHASEVARLPWHHRDPFDRLLIAQASVENLPIVSVDEAFDDYAVTRLW